MFPPQSSLIPVTVALARFVESNGLLSMFGHYPHWYLGVPYQYLTGPIIPLLQVLLHKILPNLSLFEVTYALLAFSFIASVAGWTLLVTRITRKRSIIHNSFFIILLIILPWRYLSALALSEPSTVIAKNLLPFALLAFWHYYKKRNRKRAIYAVLALSALLLINTSVFTIFLVGISALILTASFKKGKIRKVSKRIKPTLFIILTSLFVATLWYTPGYWITVITNPSIGGASGIKVFFRIFDLLKASVPLVLAVSTVYFSGKIKSRLSIFSLTWVFTFLFLTVFRFIGDPDFWQDWTAWFSEIEVGLALLASNVILDLRSKILDKKIPISYYIILVTLVLPFLLTNYVYGLLHRPKLISNTIPRGVQSLEKLNEIVNKGVESLPREPRSISGEVRVFLSGSTVFWANAIYDLNQVRGGVDKGATHPYWDHAAFQLREGNNPELARAWLKSLGVSYVLVHTPASAEVYHDFRNIGKWNKVGDLVWEEKGDVIVKVADSSLAWVTDLTNLENVRSPEGGTDLASLSNYLKAKKRPVEAQRSSANKVILTIDDLREGEGIVIAESYSRNWEASDGSKLVKDPLGNILLIPSDYSATSILLEYR